MTTVEPHAHALAPGRVVAVARSTVPLLIGVAAALGLKLAVPHFLGDFYSKVLTDIGINIILAVSLNIVNGFTGQFSIGHAGFMAIGGYMAGGLVYYGSYRLWGSPEIHGGFLGSGEMLFVAACLAGGLLAAVAGYLVGLPSLRLRGDYLAIVTLGFGEIVRVLLQRTADVPWDADEIKGVPFFGIAQLFDGEQLRAFVAGGLDFSQTQWQTPLVLRLGGALGFVGLPFYTGLFWAYVFVMLTLLTAYRLKVSSYGRAFLAIRENEIAAEAMGVPVTRFKVRAFVLAAFFAGIAGGLFAHEVGTSLNAGELAFQKSFDIVIMVVLGGMGSISGCTLAAIILTILPEALRDPPHVWWLGLIALGVALVAAGHKRGKAAVWIITITAILEVVRYLARRYGVNLSDYRMIIYALSLMLMMILRPEGLFGVREIWEMWPLRRRVATPGFPVSPVT